jgi:hypothetical protein
MCAHSVPDSVILRHMAFPGEGGQKIQESPYERAATYFSDPQPQGVHMLTVTRTDLRPLYIRGLLESKACTQ